MTIYQCEDSLEGIFTAIYNIYEDRRQQEDVRISLTDELFLFAEYVAVTADPAKVQKVINTLRRKFGEKDYYHICMALCSTSQEKAYAVYRTVADGLERRRSPGHLLDNLSDEWVHLTFALAREAEKEYDHWRQFLRFEELEKGVLYSKIGPKNHVLAYLMEHFADRFPIEDFMIYDEKRKLLGIHPAGSEWYLAQCLEGIDEKLIMPLSDREEAYQELFCCFCREIAIKERRNLSLQRNMLPLKFREYMTEFR